MTAGWLAFDPKTREQLKAIQARGVDRFGEAIAVSVDDTPLMQLLRRGPMRLNQIAMRLKSRRFAMQIQLAGLIARGDVALDDEGFYSAVTP